MSYLNGKPLKAYLLGCFTFWMKSLNLHKQTVEKETFLSCLILDDLSQTSSSRRANTGLSSPGMDASAVTGRACPCTFLNTFWKRRQRWLLSPTRACPIAVAVVQTLKLQNKRKGKEQRGLRNVNIFTKCVATSQQRLRWRDGARVRCTRPNWIKSQQSMER